MKNVFFFFLVYGLDIHIIEDQVASVLVLPQWLSACTCLELLSVSLSLFVNHSFPTGV